MVVNSFQFPEKKEHSVILSELDALCDEIPDWGSEVTVQRFGFAMGPWAKIAYDVFSQFAHKNTNNVGIHTGNNLTGTRKLEQEVIQDLRGLLNGDADTEGYLTTGGTEGNIYGMWIGREYLKSHNPQIRPVVVVNRYTHSSVLKAAKLLDLEVREITSDMGRFDTKALADYLRTKIPAIIVATAGYYSTGQVDDIEVIASHIAEQKHYMHVDAAIGGYCLPFTDPSDAFDFRIPQVGSITVDPHKLGGMGYSCGAVLFRTKFQCSIQHINELAGVNDVTLSGSRPGATAASLWALHRERGSEGYIAIINNCLLVKRYFINELKAWDPEITILGHPGINHFAFSVSKNKLKALTPEVLTQYRMVSNSITIEGKNQVFFHIYIMPHISKSTVNRFMEHVS